MSTAHRSPPANDGLPQPSPGRVHGLRSVLWNRDLRRARAVWLVLVPVVGAYVALLTVEGVATAMGVPVQVGFALMNLTAVAAVIAAIILSRRYLGGRGVRHYGLVADRRSRVDLVAGLGIGLAGTSIPFMVGLAMGWLEISAVLERGELPLLPGFAVVAAGLVFVGVWEELAMRGVFLCNTADGLRRWLSPHRSVAAALALSGLVFGLAHIAQPGHPALVLTWVLAGLVLGGMYVFSGSLALPIGVHITVNTVYQMVFLRTDIVGTERYSAVMRIDADPNLAFLQAGGGIDLGVWLVLALLTYGWLRLSRGQVSLDLVGLRLDIEPGPSGRRGGGDRDRSPAAPTAGEPHPSAASDLAKRPSR